MPNKHEFTVEMTCGGCSKAVSSVLSKTEGIASFDVSLEKQTVVVDSDLSAEAVLAVIQKTGKKASIKK